MFFGRRGFGVGRVGFRVEIKSIPSGSGERHACHRFFYLGARNDYRGAIEDR